MTEHEDNKIVEFDPTEKLIKIKPELIRPDGILILDVVRDIHRTAQSWSASEKGITFRIITEREGGKLLPGGVKMPEYIILKDGWKIQCPNNCNHVEIYGNLISSDDKSPFVTRPDGHRISYEEVQKLKTKDDIYSFIVSIVLLVIAAVIIIMWIINSPEELEPYSALVLVAFTIIQLIKQARKN